MIRPAPTIGSMTSGHLTRRGLNGPGYQAVVPEARRARTERRVQPIHQTFLGHDIPPYPGSIHPAGPGSSGVMDQIQLAMAAGLTTYGILPNKGRPDRPRPRQLSRRQYRRIEGSGEGSHRILSPARLFYWAKTSPAVWTRQGRNRLRWLSCANSG